MEHSRWAAAVFFGFSSYAPMKIDDFIKNVKVTNQAALKYNLTEPDESKKKSPGINTKDTTLTHHVCMASNIGIKQMKEALLGQYKEELQEEFASPEDYEWKVTYLTGYSDCDTICRLPFMIKYILNKQINKKEIMKSIG